MEAMGGTEWRDSVEGDRIRGGPVAASDCWAGCVSAISAAGRGKDSGKFVFYGRFPLVPVSMTHPSSASLRGELNDLNLDFIQEDIDLRILISYSAKRSACGEIESDRSAKSDWIRLVPYRNA